MQKYLPNNKIKGFTLVELLVVISIIAVLSIIGLTVYGPIQKNALDSRRKADINSIADAMEAKYDKSTGQYTPLQDTMFSSGKLPTDPQASASIRYCWITTGTCNNTTGTGLSTGHPTVTEAPNGWVICATLSDATTYCRSNIQ